MIDINIMYSIIGVCLTTVIVVLTIAISIGAIKFFKDWLKDR